ncbi:MAG: metallophosphoesterase [Eubacteriales bacterium]
MVEITNAFDKAKEIEFDSSSKIVMMSDVHRGTGGKSDDFVKNKDIFYNALKKYYDEGYTYIELGDGEELWENVKINKIINANLDIYRLMQKFYNENRLYMIFGNHDMDKKNKKYVEENFYSYYDFKEGKRKTLFPDIEIHEAILLKNENYIKKILLIHGHQADFFNYNLWYFARFLLRYFWKPLELIGVQDPTRPAKSQQKKLRVEKKLTEWIAEHNQMVIAGHTHKAVFSDIGIPPYFNDGSCVRKSGITAIEIEDCKIRLVKWSSKGNGEERETIAGPEKLKKYLKY